MSEGTATIATVTVLASALQENDVLIGEDWSATVNGVTTEDGKINVAVTMVEGGETEVLQWDTDAPVVIVQREDAGNGADNGPDRPDLTQCTATSPSGRRCKLAPDHVNSPDKDVQKHRYVIRSEVKAPPTLAELKAADKKTFAKFTLEAEDIPVDADVNRQYTGREIERDEDQKRVDADADAAYKRWTKAGSPKGKFEDIAKSSGKRYVVPPAAFDTVIMMLRRATQMGAPQAGKKLSYRRGQHVSGNVIINYLITDSGAVTTAKADGDNGGNGGE